MELDDAGRDEDIFELQHHHLLRCLERTTVSSLGRVYVNRIDFKISCLQVNPQALAQLGYRRSSRMNDWMVSLIWLGLSVTSKLLSAILDFAKTSFLSLVCEFELFNF